MVRETPIQQLQHRSLVHHLSLLGIGGIGGVPKLLGQQPLVPGTELLDNGHRFQNHGTMIIPASTA